MTARNNSLCAASFGSHPLAMAGLLVASRSKAAVSLSFLLALTTSASIGSAVSAADFNELDRLLDYYGNSQASSPPLYKQPSYEINNAQPYQPREGSADQARESATPAPIQQPPARSQSRRQVADTRTSEPGQFNNANQAPDLRGPMAGATPAVSDQMTDSSITPNPGTAPSFGGSMTGSAPQLRGPMPGTAPSQREFSDSNSAPSRNGLQANEGTPALKGPIPGAAPQRKAPSGDTYKPTTANSATRSASTRSYPPVEMPQPAPNVVSGNSQAPPAAPDLGPLRAAIPNVLVVAPGILRGGQPDANGLARLKAAGVRTIINLRNEEVLVRQEASQARALGINFVNIPMDVFNSPSEDAIRQFLKVVDNAGNQPVFVHCLHGQDRTGTMIGIYRIEKLGWSGDQAYREMVSAGFRPGFSRLSDAVFAHAANNGRPGTRPNGGAIAEDLSRRFGR